jgi:hypothetical protein
MEQQPAALNKIQSGMDVVFVFFSSISAPYDWRPSSTSSSSWFLHCRHPASVNQKIDRKIKKAKTKLCFAAQTPKLRKVAPQKKDTKNTDTDTEREREREREARSCFACPKMQASKASCSSIRTTQIHQGRRKEVSADCRRRRRRQNFFFFLRQHTSLCRVLSPLVVG